MEVLFSPCEQRDPCLKDAAEGKEELQEPRAGQWKGWGGLIHPCTVQGAELGKRVHDLWVRFEEKG